MLKEKLETKKCFSTAWGRLITEEEAYRHPRHCPLLSAFFFALASSGMRSGFFSGKPPYPGKLELAGEYTRAAQRHRAVGCLDRGATPDASCSGGAYRGFPRRRGSGRWGDARRVVFRKSVSGGSRKTVYREDAGAVGLAD